jgi:RNA 2',3'-cyclic 3'-phosphodiesterase
VSVARLFVALWPDAAVRARLAALRDDWRWPPGARPVADANLHVTLHFIGSFPRERVAVLGERLAAVRRRAVTLQAESSAVWRGGIAVLMLQGDAALATLHEDIGSALSDLGIALDARPYAAHVTLARKAAHAEPPPELPDLGWRATGFVLAESLRGPPSNYEVLARCGELDLRTPDDASRPRK